MEFYEAWDQNGDSQSFKNLCPFLTNIYFSVCILHYSLPANKILSGFTYYRLPPHPHTPNVKLQDNIDYGFSICKFPVGVSDVYPRRRKGTHFITPPHPYLRLSGSLH